MPLPMLHFHEDYAKDGEEISISYALGYLCHCVPKKTLTKPSDYEAVEIALVTNKRGRVLPSELGLSVDFDALFDKDRIAGCISIVAVGAIRVQLAKLCGTHVVEPVETPLYPEGMKERFNAIADIFESFGDFLRKSTCED